MINKGLTLTEIVVGLAMIPVITAISVGVYSTAQVNTKVSRTQKEMRKIGVAVETYYVDSNAYPFADDIFQIFSYPWNGFTFEGIPQSLSTPVAYLDTAVQQDPFAKAFGFNNVHTYHFTHNSVEAMRGLGSNYVGYKYQQCYQTATVDFQVKWVIWSHGPNLKDDFALIPIYDPTNGTISNGDLVRFGP